MSLIKIDGLSLSLLLPTTISYRLLLVSNNTINDTLLSRPPLVMATPATSHVTKFGHRSGEKTPSNRPNTQMQPNHKKSTVLVIRPPIERSRPPLSIGTIGGLNRAIFEEISAKICQMTQLERGFDGDQRGQIQ